MILFNEIPIGATTLFSGYLYTHYNSFVHDNSCITCQAQSETFCIPEWLSYPKNDSTRPLHSESHYW